MNFEDYLVLHCMPEIVEDWQSICESNNHFVVPMCARQYEKLFNKFISTNFGTDYRKGEVPFDLTQQRILQLFDNLKSNKFKFDNIIPQPSATHVSGLSAIYIGTFNSFSKSCGNAVFIESEP